MPFKVAGKGYFVFEHLKCMQSGAYVENPFYENAESIQLQNKICSKLYHTLMKIVYKSVRQLPIKIV